MTFAPNLDASSGVVSEDPVSTTIISEAIVRVDSRQREITAASLRAMTASVRRLLEPEITWDIWRGASCPEGSFEIFF
jgi:hypothetical protein